MTDDVISSDDIKSGLVAEWMQLIDASLARRSVDISSRLWPACALFVEHAIVSFGSGEDAIIPDAEMRMKFFDSKSFQEFFILILDWYRKKYGKSFDTKDDWVLKGVTIFSGVPFELRVPVLHKKSSSREYLEIKFSESVEDDEFALDWIADPPNWAEFSTEEVETIRLEANWLAGRIRKIKSELLTPERSDKMCEALSGDISMHLETAANHILQGRSYGLAYWESHQACEKVIKFILRQSSVKYNHIHNLVELYNMIPDIKKRKIGSIIMHDLPDGRQAVKARYSGNGEINLAAAYASYKRSIDFVANATKSFEFKHRLAGQSMKIRKPAFIP
ncbi:hypothetical protein Q8W71_22150 [Methylobacterium sp. NEAU 140]|uniref:hypothetical protein n=1 Tax=Methylobacterium sp. NEAU 140 TaxID=3064945 RepID=UPI002736C82F|nr:hypothetical protein [Methylobacterium sp. NEAU 140]MDP4025337.1 hypothetical protein [Methylobacterium sp. NEAU 140]